MKYKINDIIDVTVTSIVPYGVFVKADYDYTGLIHISEITGGFIKDITKYFKIGNIVKAEVIDIDEENKRLKLTTKNIIINTLTLENELVEEGNGFNDLKEKLPEWIDIAKKELENTK